MAAIALAKPSPWEIDPENFGLLKEIIDETYTDGIDSIDEAWAYPDGSIQAFVTDEGRQLAVEIGEVVNIFQTGEDASFQASFAGGKPRNCQKGTACGGTCIAKGKTCSKKASAGQKEKAKEIVAMVHVPRKAEAKAKGKKKSPSAKGEPPQKPATAKKVVGNKVSDDLKSKAMDRLNPRSVVARDQAKLIDSLGIVGDPSKMSAEDMTKILTKLDGESMVDFMGVGRKHYQKPETAKAWYRDVSRKVHPDVNKSKDAADAFKALEGVYRNMIS